MNPTAKNKTLPVPSLRNIQAFIEVADTGSINFAAENLNITASAVSHQIASLENHLGKKLFSRSSKGVLLTTIGERYLKEVSGALNIIGQATSRVIHDIHQDYLRIHSAPSFGLLWLMPRLYRFRHAWPDLKISLTCSYESIQFSRDNIDIDIRHGLSQWPTLVVKTIKNERMLPYSSAVYLENHPVKSLDDLLNCDLIHSDSTLINWNNWLSWHKVHGWNKNFIFNFDRSYMSIEAARMGMGIILESNLLAEESLRQQHLTPVFERNISMPVAAHHFVLPHANEQKEKVKAFFNWVTDELTAGGFEI
ncbi:LysR family transcriptional regulator [Salmonella enterica]|nr:LysR family transcriptional regulator [Salmonella enterica]ECJ5919372.1 LysR family transcriptional regulator [Salmonella enterica subsp. salamae]HCM1832245.1 LysR family transcriptional regulator [Salmonella enterica subsp. salamae serovar 48:z81:z39]HCM1884878.1 LysR family transcriptional regulator [Salmonella enterica subsp. salamae serovar 60:z10:z39]EAN4947951.1 LysR family transcriptional regulator [Salmonella enterica]